MLTYTTECGFPCLCENCRNVAGVNLLAKRKRDPELQEDKNITSSGTSSLIK